MTHMDDDFAIASLARARDKAGSDTGHPAAASAGQEPDLVSGLAAEASAFGAPDGAALRRVPSVERAVMEDVLAHLVDAGLPLGNRLQGGIARLSIALGNEADAEDIAARATLPPVGQWLMVAPDGRIWANESGLGVVGMATHDVGVMGFVAEKEAFLMEAAAHGIAVGEGHPDVVQLLRTKALDLADLAQACGVQVTITRRSLQPLAMRNTQLVVDAWPTRKDGDK